MLDAFESALSSSGQLTGSLPKPVFYRAQLWGAALPTNTPSVEFILDPLSRVGVAGDWCSGASMQAAAISGISLARRLAALRGVPMQASGPVEDFKHGLTKEPFMPLGAAGGRKPAAAGSPRPALTREIGQFPGS